MCGILGIFDVAPNTTQAQLRKKLIDCARRLRHRGPDWSGYQLLSRSPDGARRLMGVGASSSFDTVSKCARRVREEASPPPAPPRTRGRTSAESSGSGRRRAEL